MAPTFERPARCSVLELEGALRAPIDGGLREQVAALLERGERRIIVSVKRLSDIDAAGLGELIHVANTTMAAGGVLQIADAGGEFANCCAPLACRDCSSIGWMIAADRDVRCGWDCEFRAVTADLFDSSILFARAFAANRARRPLRYIRRACLSSTSSARPRRLFEVALASSCSEGTAGPFS